MNLSIGFKYDPVHVRIYALHLYVLLVMFIFKCLDHIVFSLRFHGLKYNTIFVEALRDIVMEKDAVVVAWVWTLNT